MLFCCLFAHFYKGAVGDAEKAQALLERALFFLNQAGKLAPDDPAPFAKLGVFLFRHCDKNDEAEEALLRCVELSLERNRQPESRVIKTLVQLTEERGDVALALQLKEKTKLHRDGSWTSSRPQVASVGVYRIGRNRMLKGSENSGTSLASNNMDDEQVASSVIDAKDLHLLLNMPISRFSLSRSNQSFEESQ